MPELPEDVLSQVMEALYYRYRANTTSDLANLPDYPTLTSCALVHSVWRAPAQTLLFKSIVLNSKFSTTFLDPDAIDSNARELLKHVRVVSRAMVSMPPAGSVSAFETLDELGTGIGKLLKRCPGVYELGIHVRVATPLSDDVVEELQRTVQLAKDEGTLNLRSLKIMECSLQSRLISKLIAALPSLEFLWINCEIGLPPVPGTTCAARLYELRLTRNISDEFLRWILESSRETLRILELRDVPGRKTKAILEPYLGGIKSLRLIPFNLTSAQLVTMCTGLEELVLSGVPNVFPLPEVLPETLTRIVVVLFTVTPRTRLGAYVKVIKTHAPLKSFSIRGSARNVDDFGLLETACRENGVELEEEDMGGWLNDPCVKATSFPRIRSVSNFSLMN